MAPWGFFTSNSLPSRFWACPWTDTQFTGYRLELLNFLGTFPMRKDGARAKIARKTPGWAGREAESAGSTSVEFSGFTIYELLHS